MMSDDSDYFRRQGDIMRSRISAYRAGTETLNDLAQDLEALRAVAASFSPEWHVQFQKAWATLEHVNAILLDEGRRDPTDVERQLITRSLREFDTLADALSQ
jgi:hypothetical protein